MQNPPGETLYHYAVVHCEELLLSIILQAKIPRFWLPVNDRMLDALYLSQRSRQVLKTDRQPRWRTC